MRRKLVATAAPTISPATCAGAKAWTLGKNTFTNIKTYYHFSVRPSKQCVVATLSALDPAKVVGGWALCVCCTDSRDTHANPTAAPPPLPQSASSYGCTDFPSVNNINIYTFTPASSGYYSFGLCRIDGVNQVDWVRPLAWISGYQKHNRHGSRSKRARSSDGSLTL